MGLDNGSYPPTITLPVRGSDSSPSQDSSLICLLWTLDASIQLSIGLFLPYRSQFQFFMDVPRFLKLLLLPPAEPSSIHPCLLNSIYLAACCLSGGHLTRFEPYFVERTRHHLQESLAYADRLTHFLWASIVLGSYFARVHRLEESYVVISSASRFALACGLNGSADETSTSRQAPTSPTAYDDSPSPSSSNGSSSSVPPSDSQQYLLPPPTDYTEALERIRLAHSMYLTDRSLAMLSGFPSAFRFDENWVQSLATRSVIQNHPSLSSMTWDESNVDPNSGSVTLDSNVSIRPI